jgi:hypothetical protein
VTTEDTQILVPFYLQYLMSLTVNSSGYLEVPAHKANERETQMLNVKYLILIVNFLPDICSGYTTKSGL